MPHDRSTAVLSPKETIKTYATFDIDTLPEGDADKGKRAFRRCFSCHTVSPDGHHKIGPNLWNIVNRPAAASPNYQYSHTLQNANLIWTPENLAHYIHNPRKFLPHNRMSFPGIRNLREIADLIAYLETQTKATPAAPQK